MPPLNLPNILTDEQFKKLEQEPDLLDVLTNEEMSKLEQPSYRLSEFIPKENQMLIDKIAIGIDEAMIGAIATAVKTPQAFGALVKEQGETGLFSDFKLFGLPFNQLKRIAQRIRGEKPEMTEVDKAVAKTGQDIIEANRRFVAEKMPDIEPSGEGGIKDFMYNLGSGATTLGAALGISLLTKSPHAASVMFGLYQKGNIYNRAREAGLEPDKASGLSTLAGGVEGALEYIGLDFMLRKYGGQLMTMAIRAGSEATQEFSQEVGENIIVKLGGINKAQGIFQGAGQAALIGAILGAPASVAIDTAEKAGVIDELKQSGFDEKQAKELLTKIVDTQKEQISKVIEDEAGFARIAGEEPIVPEKVPPVSPEVVKKPIMEARQKQLESELKNIDKQMRTLEETKVRLEKQGLKTGKIDTQLEKLSKKYTYAESQLAETIIGQPKIEQIQRELGQIRIKDIVKEEARIERGAERVGKRMGIAEEKAYQSEIAFRKRERLKAKQETQHLISQMNRISDAKNIDLNYKDQIDALLAQYDFKRRTTRTMARRESMREFVDRQKAEGEQILIPEEQLDMLDRITLNDMTLDDLRAVHGTVTALAHIGKLKNKLISHKEWRDFTQTEQGITDRIYKTGKKHPSPEQVLKTPSMRKRSIIGRVANAIDNFAAHQRKTEFIARALDGFQEGTMQDNIIEPIQQAYNQEALKQADVLGKLINIMQPIKKQLRTITNKQYDIEGIEQKLTKQEAMAVYANSKSPINREYGLMRGWGWNEKQIHNIIDSLTQEEKSVVDKSMELIDTLFEETAQVGEKLIGQKVKKRTGYWPKVTDKEISTLAVLRQKESDLFQDVIRRTYVERGFIKEIGKVAEPVSLNYFGVLLDHINKVTHFQTHALAVRDVQKLIHSPKIKQAVTDVLGENTYRQFAPWLRDIANPKSGYGNAVDRLAGWLKRNATATTLGLKVSVSLKQFGSYSQTIHELGLIPATKGFVQFYAHPFRNINFIYNKSPQMKFREKTFDREVREWMETRQAKELTGGRPGLTTMIYSLIKTVDKAATLPSWYSAYTKNFNKYQNAEQAIRYADGVVRRTQPAGSKKDLAAIMRGPNIQKIFTMFYTHFTNAYNQLANEAQKLRLGEKALPIRVVDLLVAYWWLLIVPGVLGEEVYRLGKSKPKQLLKGIASYGLNSIAIAGNFFNSLINTQFDYQASPAFGLPKDIQMIAKTKKPKTKLKYATRSLGYVTGLPMQQAWITLSGLFDLMSGETEDFRRLAFSKYQLKGEKEKGKIGKYGWQKSKKRKHSQRWR